MQRSIHPYEPYIPENATKLIIGSIPPPRFCRPNPRLEKGDVDFYYGSNRNQFWKLLGLAPGCDVEQQKNFLTGKNIGITDIIQSCARKNGNSATDQNLADLELKDIKTLLKKHNKIGILLYTSEFVKSLVEKAAGAKHTPTGPKQFEITIGSVRYAAHVLYSPSPLALRGLGKNGSAIRKQQYDKIFGIGDIKVKLS
jgi:G:T/U-mismatch repair DNA glycosylase